MPGLLYVSLSLCVLGLLGASSASDILFVNMWNSKSHAGTMLPLAERLVRHGHNVTMYSQVLNPIGKLRSVRSVETVMPAYFLQGSGDVLNNIVWNLEYLPDTLNEAYQIGSEFVTHAWSADSFGEIRRHRFDLVISDEMFSAAGFGLALDQNTRFGSKIALFATTDLFPSYSRMRALSRNPVMAPNYYTRTSRCYDYTPDNFLDRIITIRDVLFEFAQLEYASEKLMRQSLARFGHSNFRWSDLYTKTELTFSDYPDRYAWPTTVSNQMINTGSYCTNNLGKIPDDLEAFMNDTTKRGVIYVAFGSMVDWKGAPRNVIDAFFEMFTHFPDYNFIFSFKLPGYPIEKAGPNVRVLSWAPQKEIVAHNRTVLFFTHGGLKSLRESLCAGTPLLVLPFFADQMRNALNMVHLGFAEYVSKKAITVPNMVEPMRKMLSSTKYKDAILRVRSMFVDRIIHPLDEGAFWTDKMLRTNRRINFEIMGTELSYVEMFYLHFVLPVVFVFLILSN